MRKKIALLATIPIVLLLTATPAGAITGGTSDTSNQYSAVGAMLFLDSSGRYEGVCSGTLLAGGPVAQFLTAGHCTAFLAAFGIPPEHVFVTFDPRVTPAGWTGTGLAYVDPTGLTLFPAIAYQTHPDFQAAAFLVGLRYVNDVGVITLAGPVNLAPVGLPPVGFLDQQVMRGQSVLGVGYGMEAYAANGYVEWTGWRNYAPVVVSAVQPNYLHTRENPNATGQGGICGGDSGGPLLYQGYEVAQVSWGAIPCETESLNQRLDLPTVQSWLEGFLD